MMTAGNDERVIENFEEAYHTFHLDKEISKPKMFLENQDFFVRLQRAAYQRRRQN